MTAATGNRQPATPFRLGILGGGRAAWAYGSTWRRLGWPLAGVWLRQESRSRLPELLGVPRTDSMAIDADLVLIAVSDRAVEEVAAQIPETRAVVFHASGALPAMRGGFSLHPLRALPPVGEPSDLAGALLVFEGTHRAMAEQIASSAGARFAEIDPAAKMLYHAGAVFGSNYTAALLDIAQELIGIGGARDDLANLALSAIENWRTHTDARRFTGPAARGDTAVLQRHIEALESRPELAQLYRFLAERIIASTK